MQKTGCKQKWTYAYKMKVQNSASFWARKTVHATLLSLKTANLAKIHTNPKISLSKTINIRGTFCSFPSRKIQKTCLILEAKTRFLQYKRSKKIHNKLNTNNLHNNKFSAFLRARNKLKEKNRFYRGNDFRV